MAARTPVRALMGTWNDLGTWQRVYETAEAVEVDESNGMTGMRHRVFYDEVLLVTYHSSIGWAMAVLASIIGGFIAMAALVAVAAGDTRTAVTISFFALLAAGFIALRLVIKLDSVTIYGRRSRARVSFWLNKDRARATYLRVCARVRHAQERSAARSAERTPAPEPSTEVAS